MAYVHGPYSEVLQMTLIQRIAFVLLFVFSTFVQADTIRASNPGIAFVHGTRDHREDAYGGYWKTDYINGIAQALPNPDNLLVVHCDFSHYLWHEDAGNCVAAQLSEFIKDKHLTSLTVYTHSDGGNIVRWIISNPTYNNDFYFVKQNTKQVIAIAPSSGGTPLADEVLSGGLFESSIAWLLGYTSDAVKQQRVGDMLVYNNELLFGTYGRPELPLPFRVIVGTDVTASPFSSLSYCNGYLENSGLKLTKIYLETCADGFLNCSSQKTAGEVWFYDKDKTENNKPLSHNQSRHSCSGLDKILITAFANEGAQP